MGKRSIPGGHKDENGIFVRESASKPTPELNLQSILPEPEVSLDDIAKRMVTALNRATKHLLEKINSGDVSREVIGALKDCEAMHRELAKKEKDFLDSLSDEELEKLSKK